MIINTQSSSPSSGNNQKHLPPASSTSSGDSAEEGGAVSSQINPSVSLLTGEEMCGRISGEFVMERMISNETDRGSSRSSARFSAGSQKRQFGGVGAIWRQSGSMGRCNRRLC